MSYLCSNAANSQQSDFGSDLEYLVMITVYKSKKKKCKSIGSIQTTIQVLIDSSNSLTKESHGIDDDSPRKFELRSPALGFSEVTGFISVVRAEVCEEQREDSQRFMKSDSYDDSNMVTSMEDTKEPEDICANALISPPTFKFVDYTNAGLNIDLCVAIDFVSDVLELKFYSLSIMLYL